MKKELVICLPIYKIIYSLAFVLILSLIRGIAYADEIGGAMEPAIALLTIIFCSDTYMTEIQSRRGEVFHLYNKKRKTAAILRRLAVQFIYLMIASILGYVCYLIQKPSLFMGTSHIFIFGMFLAAIVVTIAFWGIVSMTICNLWRNVWAGIGSTLIIWLMLNSQIGDRLFKKWNIFSYTFCSFEQLSSFSWLCGKAVSVIITIALVGMIPTILKKRG